MAEGRGRVRSERAGRRGSRICRASERFCPHHSGESIRGTSAEGDAAGPGLYGDRLLPEQQGIYEKAIQIKGLDDEIALLRVIIHENVEDHQLVLRAIALLARALATRYRLSGEHEDELYQNILGVLKGIGEAVLPES